jgi:hypothetical protein
MYGREDELMPFVYIAGLIAAIYASGWAAGLALPSHNHGSE